MAVRAPIIGSHTISHQHLSSKREWGKGSRRPENTACETSQTPLCTARDPRRRIMPAPSASHRVAQSLVLCSAAAFRSWNQTLLVLAIIQTRCFVFQLCTLGSPHFLSPCHTTSDSTNPTFTRSLFPIHVSRACLANRVSISGKEQLRDLRG